MVFIIDSKVALITGGASGIGFACGKHLLKNGLKGLTIADINEDLGRKVAEEFCTEFGGNKAIFVKTDVTNKTDVKNAFEKTYSSFGSVDIVLNNAGIASGILYEKEMSINFCAMVTVCLKAMEEYLPKYKSGPEAVILNTASIAGLDPICSVPVYTATKFGIVGLTKSVSHEEVYKMFQVRVIAICPSVTLTNMVNTGVVRYKGRFDELPTQPADFVGSCVPDIIRKGKNGSVWVIENSEEPYEVSFPSRQERKINK